MLIIVRAVPLLTAIGLAGCEYYPSEGDLTPSSIQILQGDGQLRAAGLDVRIPLSVKVADVNGAPAAGVPVEFVAQGSAVVSPVVVPTDAAGIARVSLWKLRTDGGPDSLIARTANGVSVTFRAMSLVFTDISVANDVSCGLTTSGLAACWGNTSSVQRQGGEENGVRRPRLSNRELRFSQFAAGSIQACGLTLDHRVLCAGTTDFTMPSHLDFRESGAGQKFTDLAVLSRGPRCAIGEDARGFCWGSPLDPVNPVPLSQSPAPLRQLAVGYYYASVFGQPNARACSLDRDGRVRCYDPLILLLDGSWVAQTTERFDSIAVSGIFGCGLKGREAWCWGSTSALTLGSTPVGGVTRVPLPPVNQIKAAGLRVCALTDEGVYCLGNFQPPAVVPGTADLHLVQISISEDHACGIDRHGSAWCWGSNGFGQLGNDSTVDSPAAVRVQPDL